MKIQLTVRKRDAGRNRIVHFTTSYLGSLDDSIFRELDSDPDAVILVHRTRDGDREEFRRQLEEDE